MKKKLTVCILAVILSAFLAPAAMAREVVAAEESYTAESVTAAEADEAATGVGTTDAEDEQREGASTENGYTNVTPKENETEDAAEPTASVSGAVRDFLEEYLGEVFCLLTFIGTLLSAFLYKTGLLPLLRSGLSALGDRINKSGRDTEAFIEGAKEELAAIERAVAPATAALEELRSLSEDTKEALAEVKGVSLADSRERARLRHVLLTETELFYQLLQSVNLPQAQKENMSESYFALKRALEEEA